MSDNNAPPPSPSSGHVAPTPVPNSYTGLGHEHIKLSHIPAESPSPTPIILVTLNRPKNYNAFTETMMKELVEAFSWFDRDDRVKCIVVTGAGRMFCAGADLDIGFQGGKERAIDHRDGGGRVALAIHHCRKPVIGALNGSAVGVGITMTLPMAIRIVASSAKIGFVFARRGIIMEACSSFFLPRLIGHARAMRLVTTGATYPASDTHAFGPLFAEVVSASEGKTEAEAVLLRALEVAKEIVTNTSVVSTALMRDLIWRNPGSAELTHLLDSRVIYDLFSSADNKEGVAAFKEKRPVNFQGTLQKDAPEAYPWWDPVDTRGPFRNSSKL